MKRTIYLLLLLLVGLSARADENVFRKTTYKTGSQLDISTGVSVNFLAGSILTVRGTADFTGATLIGLASGGSIPITPLILKGNSLGGAVGITDPNDINSFINASVAPVFGNNTSKPTTLVGYGITDGQPLNGNLTAWAAISGTHTLYYRSGANTFAAVTVGAGLDFTGATLSATGGAGAGDALTTNPLSQFAATTSLQLAGVLTNETGTGLAVFGTSPVFTTDITTPKVIFATSVFDLTGTGSPETVVTANIGSTFRRTDGGTNTTFYRKESGTGNTGWVALSNAASGATIPNTTAILKGDGAGNGAAASASDINTVINSTVAPVFANNTSKPTTLSGYGITNALAQITDTALAGGTTIVAGSKNSDAISGPKSYVFSGSPSSVLQPTVLKLNVSSGPVTITIPSSQVLGGTAAITSVTLQNGYHELAWTYAASVWWLNDPTDLSMGAIIDPTDNSKQAIFILGASFPTATTRSVFIAPGGNSTTVIPNTATNGKIVVGIGTSGAVTMGYPGTSSPTTLSVSQDNWSPPTTNFFIRVVASANINITGLNLNNSDGEFHVLFNATTRAAGFNITLKHESASTTTATHRMDCNTAADIVVAPQQWVFIENDGTDVDGLGQRYRVAKLP